MSHNHACIKTTLLACFSRVRHQDSDLPQSLNLYHTTKYTTLDSCKKDGRMSQTMKQHYMGTASQVPRQHSFICTARYPCYNALTTSIIAQLQAHSSRRVSTLLAGLLLQHAMLVFPTTCNGHFFLIPHSSRYFFPTERSHAHVCLKKQVSPNLLSQTPQKQLPEKTDLQTYRLKTTDLNRYVSSDSCLPFPILKLCYCLILFFFHLAFCLLHT